MTDLFGSSLATGAATSYLVAGADNVLLVSDLFDALTRLTAGGDAGWINDAAGTVTLLSEGVPIDGATDLALAAMAQYLGAPALGRALVRIPADVALVRGAFVDVEGEASGHTDEDPATLITFPVRGRLPVF
jgi:hypothetical protein